MHDEVFEAAHDSHDSAASSPSDAYASLSLDAREPAASMTTGPDHTSRRTSASDHTPPRAPPRASSPAKRPHSDMDDSSSGHAGQRNAKQPSTTAQHSARAASIEMPDAPANSNSTSSDDTTSTPAESAATSISAQPSPPRPSNVPSLDEQVAKVMAIAHRPLTDGQEGFIVGEKWLARVFARTTENRGKPEQFDKEALEGEIGPVDNSNLVDTAAALEDLTLQNGESFIPLRQGLTMGQDFEVLPVDAWELIMSWYGNKEASPVIRRYAHNTALDEFSENIQFELYPPVFTIRKLRKSSAASPSAPDAAKAGPKLVASRSDGFVDFLKAAKKAAGIDMKTKVRVWRVLNTAPTDIAPPEPSGMLTPNASPPGTPVTAARPQPLPLLIDSATFTALADGTERELVTGKDETANEKYNGRSTLHITGLAEDQVLILEEQDDKGEYLTDHKASQKGSLQSSNKAAAKNKGLQSGATSGRSSPAPSGPVTRGRTRNGRTRGTVGLTNLGNTCYMNSALQCIRSVEELSIYFLEDDYKKHLNPDNPLGHGGAIAKVYAGLLSQIYDVRGQSSFAPKNFKSTLGRVATQFSGYGQQDSQEFLSFLVDGLHEDLNRIKKKPYTENPESDDNTVHDPEAIKALGERFRQIHHSRNDSVATDLFNGFYKNTMVCPDCNKVSITFDPFSLVTLQLPIEQTWQHTITFVPLRGKVVNIEIDIDKNSTIKGVKEYIAKRFDGVKWERLMGAEVYSHKFYKILNNNMTIPECNISQRDAIFFYELESAPTNWPPKKKKRGYNSHSSEEDIPKSASPLSDRMVVPIFHRAKTTSTYRGAQWSLSLWPSFVVLTREEAKDKDSIFKKVLGKVAQMTTRPILSELTERAGSDIVLTTEEDASPNGDPHVQDGSVEGEDMVEVTMTDSDQTKANGAPSSSELPEVLKPGTSVPAAFESLFDIKFSRPGREIVPTGWQWDGNKQYESIAARIRARDSTQPSQSPEADAEDASNASSSEEIDDAPQFSADAQSSIEQAEQSSDEDIPPVATETFGRDNRYNSKKNQRKNKKQQKKFGKKHAQKYSRKGKDRSTVPDQPSPYDTDNEDEEALIRLGEALVLDWHAEAYDGLFDGNPNNSYEDRGVDALKFVDTFEDSELEAKRAKRLARKRNGITLEECFAETSKSEVLSEDNAWYCNRCKELRRATKTLEIWTVPDILVIHLKRFSAHRTFRDKVDAFVDCPIEGLDLSGKVGLPEDKGLMYDLFAVDNHYGGLGGGHYTACARNFYDGQWYDYNDSSVSQRNPSNVVTQAAYLLFYRRRSERPLGPQYLQDIVMKSRNPDPDSASDDSGNEQAGSRTASRSPAGNGWRLDGSSRNGSSSAYAAGAGVLGAGAGGALGVGRTAGAGSEVGAGGMIGMADEGYALDEGYAEPDDDDANFTGVGISGLYQTHARQAAAPYQDNSWSFDSLSRNNLADDADPDDASMNAGSGGVGDAEERLIEDFGDEIGMEDGILPGLSTPLGGDDVGIDVGGFGALDGHGQRRDDADAEGVDEIHLDDEGV